MMDKERRYETCNSAKVLTVCVTSNGTALVMHCCEEQARRLAEKCGFARSDAAGQQLGSEQGKMDTRWQVNQSFHTQDLTLNLPQTKACGPLCALNAADVVGHDGTAVVIGVDFSHW